VGAEQAVREVDLVAVVAAAVLVVEAAGDRERAVKEV